MQKERMWIDMCLAIPLQLIEINGNEAIAEANGVRVINVEEENK